MSKKKSNTAAPKTTATTAPKTRAPRAPRASWTTKQRERVNKLKAGLTRLAELWNKARPNDVQIGDEIQNIGQTMQAIDACLDTLTTGLTKIGDAWKPTAKGKVGPGSKINVKLDKVSADVFKAIPATVFAGAEVVGADGKTNWIVKCADGAVRIIAKGYVEQTG